MSLSAAAQRVLDAFTADSHGVWLEGDPERIAAALRAAVEEVLPVDNEYWDGGLDDRNAFLAIAAELEAQG